MTYQSIRNTPEFKGTLTDKRQNSSIPVIIKLMPGHLQLDPEFGPEQAWAFEDIDSARRAKDMIIMQRETQWLTCVEPGFMEAVNSVFPQNKWFKTTFFDRNGTLGCLLILAFLLVPLWGIFKLIVPWIADYAAQKVSIDYEQKIGQTLYTAMISDYSVDTEKTAIAQEFYNQLNWKTDYDIKITVVNEPVVNAFAMPGGNIVVFDSIINIMDQPEQLIALLGHETSHITLKHSTRNIFRNLGNSLLISIIFGSDVTSEIALKASELGDLAYSRELELEADDNGAVLMKKIGINTNGMRMLFEKMKGSMPSSEAGKMPDFMSTHPSIDERIERLSKSTTESPLPDTLSRLWVKLAKQ